MEEETNQRGGDIAGITLKSPISTSLVMPNLGHLILYPMSMTLMKCNKLPRLEMSIGKHSNNGGHRTSALVQLSLADKWVGDKMKTTMVEPGEKLLRNNYVKVMRKWDMT